MDLEEKVVIGSFGVFFVAIAVFLVLGEMSQAGMRRQTPLHDMKVMQWNSGAPAGAEYQWQGQLRIASIGWTPTALDVQPGDCVAYVKGLALRWRGCFVDEEGNVLNAEDGAASCAEAEQAEKLATPCVRIVNLSGVEFDAGDVARWNAAHVELPE